MTVVEYVASLECCDTCLCITVCDVVGTRATDKPGPDGRLAYANVYRCKDRRKCGERTGRR